MTIRVLNDAIQISDTMEESFTGHFEISHKLRHIFEKNRLCQSMLGSSGYMLDRGRVACTEIITSVFDFNMRTRIPGLLKSDFHHIL